MKLDFLTKLKQAGASMAGARKKPGAEDDPMANYMSLFDSEPGSPGGEMDLERFVSLRPKMPDGMDPRQMYGNLYSSYGGRKMRGLLFD